MASAADYLKLAQTGYGVEPFDVGKMYADAGKGMALAEGVEKRSALADVGLAASRGDMQGAERTAYGRGLVDVGLKLGQEQRTQQSHNVDTGIKLSTEERTKVSEAFKQLAEIGQTAETQNDQQWAQSIQMWRSKGMQVPPEFEGPNGRAQASAMARMTIDKARSEIAQRQASANASNASAGLAGVQTETARRELDNPATRITIAPEGSTVIATDPRSRQSSVVYQGQSKADATTKKEIQEADDFVAQTQSAITSLNQAIELNRQAYAGATAGARAGIVNNTLGAVRPQPGAIATGDLENVVTNQALSSLRATFGGNPTEGERKILMEVAGSINQPAALREKIYARALELAKQRLIFNSEKAKSLRGGTYYQPGGQPPSPAPAAAPAPAARQRAVNRSTGQAVEWDGSAWVPAQ